MSKINYKIQRHLYLAKDPAEDRAFDSAYEAKMYCLAENLRKNYPHRYLLFYPEMFEKFNWDKK